MRHPVSADWSSTAVTGAAAATFHTPAPRRLSMKICCVFTAVALVLHPLAGDVYSGKKPESPVRELKLGAAAAEKFKPTSVKMPTIVAAADDAVKLFDGVSAETIKKEVNFEREKLLVFSWQGSGGDRLRPALEKEAGKAIVVFHYTAGLTDDLRRHFHVYVLPRDADWRVSAK
jgi:hypothetical protein